MSASVLPVSARTADVVESRGQLERAVVFGGRSPLVGILNAPHGGAAQPLAFILLNSGLIHRVGPNCQNTALARSVAAMDVPSLRFDHSGVGDSPPAQDSRMTTERWADEIRDALDYLEGAIGARQFVLLGNCSGAIGALMTARTDERVVGTCLLNLPPAGSRARYLIRLSTNANFWRRLRRGRLRIDAMVHRLARRVVPRTAAQTERLPTRDEIRDTLLSLARRGTRILLVSCQWDPSYDTYNAGMAGELKAQAPPGTISIASIWGANHDFSLVRNQQDLAATVLGWAGTLAAPPASN